MSKISMKQLSEMTDEEIYDLSLRKDKKGRYTYAANLAYFERQKRNGIDNLIGRGDKASKWSADFDYYGYTQ